jgi:hypothetical protein
MGRSDDGVGDGRWNSLEMKVTINDLQDATRRETVSKKW